ncbi:MAG: hypothetical protein US81_C0030G0004 [Parcubacteria group bacterium GW2011_GWE2_38_18]|nr:MAG: hypothetical protein US81_C0030G0004 [Parcubacteria group bacterium GW2011_GWE2_38_18]
MITEKDLKNLSFIKQIKLKTDRIIVNDSFNEAYELSKELTDSINNLKSFREKNYDLYLEYKKIIIKLRWIGLNVMKDEDVVGLFKNSFVNIFEISEFNVWEKLKIVLLAIINLDERDKYKKDLREALLGNQQKITSNDIIVDNQLKLPTISNWLRGYIQSLGQGSISKLQKEQYLTNSNNVRGLNEYDKNRLRLLFNIFEKLKLSSQTFEGFEEDVPVDEDDVKGTIRQGSFEPLPKNDDKQRIVDKILSKINKIDQRRLQLVNELNKYSPQTLEYKAIEEEIKKLEGR